MIKPDGSRPCYHSSTLLQWRQGMQHNCLHASTHANDLGEEWREQTVNPMHLMSKDGGQTPNFIDPDTQVYIMYVCRCARVSCWQGEC